MPQVSKAADTKSSNNIGSFAGNKVLADDKVQDDSKPIVLGRLLFICYCLSCAVYGCLDSMAASLFNDLSEQLDTTELQTSYIVLARTFGFILAAFVSAFMVDKFKASHRYFAAILTMGATLTALIPFSRRYYVQMLLWAGTGMVNGTVDTSLTVYTYRFWSEKGSSKYVIYMVIVGCFRTVCPVMIQSSVNIFGCYRYALFVVSFIAIIAGLMALCLKTPEHDDMRTIQAAMAKSATTKNAELVQQELAEHNKLKYTVATLWCIFYSVYGLVQSGSVTHISVYCSDYLDLSSGMARYLISMYSAGQLTHRVSISIASRSSKELKEKMESTDFMMWYLLAMTLIMACLTAIWLFMPFEMKLHSLYLVFPALGFTNSALAPYVVHLVESVTPVSGTISCILMMMYGAGDFLIVFVNGELIQRYGAMIQPAAISSYCLLMVPFVIFDLKCCAVYKIASVIE